MINLNHVHQISGSDARYRIAHVMEQPVDFDETVVGGDPDDSEQRRTIDRV